MTPKRIVLAAIQGHRNFFCDLGPRCVHGGRCLDVSRAVIVESLARSASYVVCSDDCMQPLVAALLGTGDDKVTTTDRSVVTEWTP